MKSIKATRSFQIGVVSLLKYIKDIQIDEAQSPYYDIIVTERTTGLKFGVEIESSSFLRTNSYNYYLNRLDGIELSDSNNRIPIVILAVNESTEKVMVGMQVGWYYGKVHIFHKPSMMEVDANSIDIIVDKIKSMDDSIRLLSIHGMKVKKTISVVKKESNGMLHHAQFVYLRDFTEQYKMNQKKVVSSREKFEHLVYGIPENEYPSDLLDDSILGMVKKDFPEAELKSSTILFNSDIRDIQFLSGFTKIEVPFNVIPDITPEALQRFQNPKEVFSIDIFVSSQFDVKAFQDMSYFSFVPFNDWMNFQKALATVHSPSEMFL